MSEQSCKISCMLRNLVLALLIVDLCSAAGCKGGDKKKEPAKTSVGDPSDASMSGRGGLGNGGGISSGGGGGSTTKPDAGDASTTSMEDASIDPTDPYAWTTCTPSDATVAKVDVPFTDESGQALVPSDVGFGIAYRVSPACDEIHATAVPAFGEIPLGMPALGQDTCVIYRDLTMLRVDYNWLLAWVDNSSGSAELYAQPFDNDFLPVKGALQVTDNSDMELRPELTDLAGTPLLSYIVESTSGRSIYTKRMDSTNDPIAVIKEGDGYEPARMAVSQLGFTGAALGWVNEAAPSGIYLQPLKQTGAASGSPIKLSDFAGGGATVDIAIHDRGADTERGGAIVYSIIIGGVAHEVRFRRLGEDGTPLADERVIIEAPLAAQGASISSVGDGYVIAYRALPDGSIITEPQIRLLFATREGNIAHDTAGRPVTYEVAKATLAEGRVTVRMSVEGQLLISWLDADPNTGQMVLKYSRRPLNCP